MSSQFEQTRAFVQSTLWESLCDMQSLLDSEDQATALERRIAMAFARGMESGEEVAKQKAQERFERLFFDTNG